MKHTDSQSSKILRHLRKGKRLTALQALHFFGCLRLSGRVMELRDAGVNVKTEMVKVNGKYIAKYSL